MITRTMGGVPTILDKSGRPVTESGGYESVPAATLRRLRKVLAMAGRPESPEQSAAAAAVAEKILRRYDLTVAASAVLGIPAPDQGPDHVIAHCIYACGLKVWNWVKVIISAVTVAHHCHTDIVHIVDAAGRVDHTEFICYGTAADTALVRQIVELIVSQIELGAAFYRRGDRHSFRAGAAVAVASRIQAAHKEAESEVKTTLQDRLKLPAGRAEQVVETALAVLDKRRERAQAASAAAGSAEGGRGYADLKPRSPDGYADGYAAGMKMRVHVAHEISQAK